MLNFKQPSTWAGLIVAGCALFGLSVSEPLANSLVLLFTAAVGVYEILRDEHKY
jgi:hypothetical protein